jgi:hypothetical protein
MTDTATHPLYQVDSFTKKPFAGNPAAVCLTEGPADEVWMQRSAAEREAGLEKLKVESIVHSDGWKAYNKLSLNGFHHRRINHDKTLVDGKVPIHCIENCRGYAKRRLKA